MNEVKWIKLMVDVFDNEKIRYIEQMPEADSILVIWFKLICLAGKKNDNGLIYFQKEFPYTDEMLAAYLMRSVNLIRLALETFSKLHMIEYIDDIMHLSNWEKYQNVEGMEKIKEQNRIRAANYRKRQKEAQLLLPESEQKNEDVSITLNHVTPLIDIDKEKEEDKKEIIKEKDQKTRKTKRPYGKYQNVMLTDSQLEKLKTEHPDTYTYWIEECSTYCDSKEVSYSDYLRTIRNWINKSPKKEEYFKKLAEENKPKVKKAPSRYYEYFEEARSRKDTMNEDGWSKPLIYHAASEINWDNDLNAERDLFFARISFLEKMNIVM